MEKLEGQKPVSSPTKNKKSPPPSQPSEKAGAQAAEGSQQLTLERYASIKNISEQEAWRHIHSGLILARITDDEVLIYLKADQVPAAEVKPASADLQALVPLPDHLPTLHSLTTSSMHPSEMTLLIDHLSLAKEENLEILKMSQSTLSEMRLAYDGALKFKDQTLADEKARNEKLAQQLAEAQQHISDLKQQIEDLKMLEKMR